jgi:hypothetical protein
MTRWTSAAAGEGIRMSREYCPGLAAFTEALIGHPRLLHGKIPENLIRAC